MRNPFFFFFFFVLCFWCLGVLTSRGTGPGSISSKEKKKTLKGPSLVDHLYGIMDAISDSVFTDFTTVDESSDDPSLLTVILDISPKGWFNIRSKVTLNDVTKSLLVFLNAHLSLNNSNQVAFITSSPQGSRFLYPNPEKNYDERSNGREPSPGLINKGMYRQFRIVDEAVLIELNEEIEKTADSISSNNAKSTLSGAVSLALTYTNRMLNLDQSITTTTASAINSTTNMNNNSSTSVTNSASNSSVTASGGSGSLTQMKLRILIISANDEDNINYIPIMNTIFAAQKMKLSIDVAKLGEKDSSYLQQAADATSGVYLHIDQPEGLIQTLCTAFFIEPSIRPLFILPTNSNVNYRASCFVTGKSVDLGLVCSVCLCIMSLIPKNGKCPTCQSKFDEKILQQLSKLPLVAPRKKRKVDS